MRRINATAGKSSDLVNFIIGSQPRKSNSAEHVYNKV